MSKGQSLKIILFLFMLSFLNYESSSDPNYLAHSCSNTTFTSNSTYQVNLNKLLSSLASGGPKAPNNEKFTSGFYNYDVGQGPDRVYGLFLCRGDIDSTICEDCVKFACREVTQRCPDQKEAIIWYDPCFLRYSNASISSVMVTKPRLDMWNIRNSTDPELFNRHLMKLMVEVADSAASSPRYFATRSANVTAFQTIYCLAQCTPDLSASDCKKCLEKAELLIAFKLGGRIYYPSCFLRYEVYPFANNVTFVSPPPSMPPSLPPVESTTRRKGKGRITWIAIGVSASVFVLVVLFGYSLWHIFRKNKTEKKSDNQGIRFYPHGEAHDFSQLGEHKLESQDFPLLPLSLVLNATQSFSPENKLGEGGFGPVYKGVLPDGKEIAVKRLSSASKQGLLEFKNEVTTIVKLQHKNLVRLIGCCSEEDELLLVYEYMPNKSLDFHLFDPNRRAQLDWNRSSSIINGIARGILYLHEDSRLKIIHRDLKASNVLLDQEMNPKISDFGMARIFCGNQNEANTKKAAGTYGYMAPEYAMEGLFSVKSDVFSFGVLLLEIISGRKNYKFYLAEEGESLLTYTWKLWCEGQAMEVLDPVVAKSCPDSEALKCINIGLLCVQEDPTNRPTMSKVVLWLSSDTVILPQPTEPPSSIGGAVMKATESSSDVKICSANQVTLTTFSPR